MLLALLYYDSFLPTYVCVKLYLINYSSQKVLRAFLVSFVSGRIAEEKAAATPPGSVA